MKKSLIVKTLIGLPIASVMMTGCVDDSYDLENINTDVEVKVNDLVIPINLDAITLSNAFDLDDGSVIKEINGEYAVVVNGDFHSDPINIKPVVINPGTISPIESTVYKFDGIPGAPSVPVEGRVVAYEIHEAVTDFSFGSSNVDSSIRDLLNIKGSWNITLNLMLSDLNSAFEHIEFQQLTLTLPAGMHVSNYPCTNGDVSLGNVVVSVGRPSAITLAVDEIDFTKFTAAGFKFTPGTEGANNGNIQFNGKVGVKSGYVLGALKPVVLTEPQLVKLTVTPQLNTINVKSVSGNVNYQIDGFDVANVTLDDIPDMLRDDDTNITLANPQLYFSVNNPMADYGLTASSGLTLESYKYSNPRPVKVCELDAGSLIKINADKGIDGPYNFCLSPSKPDGYYEGYAAADFVGFKSLSDLLSGDGLPDYVKVTFNAPHAGPDNVTDFVLGTDLQSVHGNYTLYAPLELGVGSQIVYQEDETGWDDETISKITVTTLKVEATVTNSLPVDIVVSGTPLDVNGRPCVDPKTNKPVSLEGLTIAAGTTAPVELKSTGTIVGIDGIRYTATCRVTKAGQVLSPSSPIELRDIKVTVGGSYRDTL
ncbi:MAG: hypothetical protein K2N28_06530 [Muribaculaceae bacterium]|nr:hypothetical protein [Muribaculaceae bacterium]